jgi:Ca2+:H+ antiporter
MHRLNLNYLLILIPVALALAWFRANPLLVFVTSALTILPLSKVVGSSTETLELISLIIAVFITRQITIAGESDWLEGAMLVAVFGMLAIGFYFAA